MSGFNSSTFNSAPFNGQTVTVFGTLTVTLEGTVLSASGEVDVITGSMSTALADVTMASSGLAQPTKTARNITISGYIDSLIIPSNLVSGMVITNKKLSSGIIIKGEI